MRELAGTIVGQHGMALGRLRFSDVIEDVSYGPPDAADGASEAARNGDRRDEATAGGHPERAPYLLPGFIDVHVHGGGGSDTMDGLSGARRAAEFHLAHGVTTLLPTTMTRPWPEVLDALDGVARLRPESGREGVPRVPGAHLEGPFVSPERLGAQPPFAVPPTTDLVRQALSSGVVRVATMAPELEGAVAAATAMAAEGVRVSVGHTNATYRQVMALLEAVKGVGGTVGFTHLFNAMTQLGSREPGAVGAALATPWAFAELILDAHHVHPASFLAASRAKPGRMLLVSDAIRAAGRGDGETELGGQAVKVEGGAARLVDGTLAGSVLTLDAALRNAVAFGLSLPEAAAMVSLAPARYLGLTDRGELSVGALADIVVLDERLEVVEVYLGGEPVGVSAQAPSSSDETRA